MGDRLQDGEKLEVGQSLTSLNGAYKLTLQDDGNLVLYSGDDAVWSTGTNGKNVVSAPRFRRTATSSSTRRTIPCGPVRPRAPRTFRLILQNDRNLVLYGFDGPAWSSNTQTDEAPVTEPPPAAEPEVVPAAVTEESRRRRRSARATAAPAAAAAPAPHPATYTVVSGDTLWAIAERFYGDGNKYHQIAEASGIANPDLIHPGQVVTIP